MKKPEKGTLDSATRRKLKRLKKIEAEHEALKKEHALLKKSIQLCSDRKKKFSSS